MHCFIARVVLFALWLLATSSILQAQNPFGDSDPPEPRDSAPLEDEESSVVGEGGITPPEGFFEDVEEPVDDTKAPKDGGAIAPPLVGTDAPESGAEAYERGVRLMEEGEWRDAIDYLSDSIAANSKSAAAYLARAEARTRLAGETADSPEREALLDEAVADCNAALKLKPRSKEAYLARGIAQRLQNGYKQANVSFTSAIELDSKFAEAYVRRGIVLFYLNKEEIAPAIFDFDNAIRLNPQDYRAHLWRGLLYSRNGEYDQALVSFDQALAARPDYADALNNRGLTYLKLGEFEKALADFADLTRIAKEDKTAFFKRGVAETELGRYDDAIASFKKAVFLDPNYADAFYNRSIAYAEIDELDKSDADFREAVRLNPDLRD
jgi:tetratricopeptide (TPR) repeat protein